MKAKEKDFPISNYPLEQTEFYYAQKQGMVSSNNENPSTCIFCFYEANLKRPGQAWKGQKQSI